MWSLTYCCCSVSHLTPSPIPWAVSCAFYSRTSLVQSNHNINLFSSREQYHLTGGREVTWGAWLSRLWTSFPVSSPMLHLCLQWFLVPSDSCPVWVFAVPTALLIVAFPSAALDFTFLSLAESVTSCYTSSRFLFTSLICCFFYSLCLCTFIHLSFPCCLPFCWSFRRMQRSMCSFAMLKYESSNLCTQKKSLRLPCEICQTPTLLPHLPPKSSFLPYNNHCH